MRKFNSIPESEPLYKILKSRTIDTNTIKNKEERTYWKRLKKINAIPSDYLSTEEVLEELKSYTQKERKLWLVKI